jgi:pimeloyl-ACP methyl ester carboxylesterase
MVARLQRTTALMLWAVALAWLALRAGQGQWVSGLIGALLLLNIQPMLLAVEFFVLLPWINRCDTLPKPTLRQLLRAWSVESLTAHDVFGWQQPFRTWAHADTLDAARRGQRAVVLVHGFFCNRAVWNRWVGALRDACVPHLAITMEPPFSAIDSYVETIDAAIDRARGATGMAPLVVCHSMGGLALRAWWFAHRASAGERVHGVITIGSPHHGTFTARLARGVNARQMRLGSAWLAELAAAEAREQRSRFTCFYSHCDNIVMPASSAMLPGADNRHLEGRAHVAMVYAPEVLSEVLRRVAPRAAY